MVSVFVAELTLYDNEIYVVDFFVYTLDTLLETIIYKFGPSFVEIMKKCLMKILNVIIPNISLNHMLFY